MHVEMSMHAATAIEWFMVALLLIFLLVVI